MQIRAADFSIKAAFRLAPSLWGSRCASSSRREIYSSVHNRSGDRSYTVGVCDSAAHTLFIRSSMFLRIGIPSLLYDGAGQMSTEKALAARPHGANGLTIGGNRAILTDEIHFRMRPAGNAAAGTREGRRCMAIEKVRAYFARMGIADRIREFDVSSATVPLAAAALGCEPCRIAKTLSFMTDGGPVLIVAAGDVKVDNGKYKAFFKQKARMLTPQEAETLVGHAVGGVCPFAVNDGVRVYLDVSLRRFGTVFPACGSGNSAIEMTVDELEKYSGSVAWIDVTKPAV